VGFEASVCIPFLLGLMAHYNRKYKIILAIISGTIGEAAGEEEPEEGE
jgi:hypothetical protein